MKLDFSIIWIDDNDDFISAPKKFIKRHIRELGFNPIIRYKDEVDINDIEQFRNYDILLIDYQLTKGGYFTDSGDTLIKHIRDNNIYTNIVFYSNSKAKMEQSIIDNQLFGVYSFSRGDLSPDKLGAHKGFFDLIDFFMERDLDMNSMRGIAMSEVAEFDREIFNLILRFSEVYPDEDIIEKVLKRTRAISKCRAHKIDAMSDNELSDLIHGEKSTIYFDSSNRADFFHSKVLKKQSGAYGGLLDCYNKMKTGYKNDITVVRNKLAHYLVNNADEQLSKDEMKKFRKDLIEHKDNFAAIKEIITKNNLFNIPLKNPIV